MKIPIIEKLYFSPVKSLSFSYTIRVYIKKNIGIKNDRIFAFTRFIEKKEALTYQNEPGQRKLKFFLTLKNSPFLNKYNFNFSDNNLSLYFEGKIIDKVSLSKKNNYEALSKALMKREKLIKTTPYLIYNDKNPFFDTMPQNSISLININSIKDFEKLIERKIELERFRANLYINNVAPWEEFNWINKRILINNCLFKVIKKIPRCSATNLIPNFDISNINLPIKLKKCYGHNNMGVYLIPLTDGEVEIGDKIKFQ